MVTAASPRPQAKEQGKWTPRSPPQARHAAPGSGRRPVLASEPPNERRSVRAVRLSQRQSTAAVMTLDVKTHGETVGRRLRALQPHSPTVTGRPSLRPQTPDPPQLPLGAHLSRFTAACAPAADHSHLCLADSSQWGPSVT